MSTELDGRVGTFYIDGEKHECVAREEFEKMKRDYAHLLDLAMMMAEPIHAARWVDFDQVRKAAEQVLALNESTGRQGLIPGTAQVDNGASCSESPAAPVGHKEG